MRVFFVIVFAPNPRNGVLQTYKLKTHLLRTQSSKILPLKPEEDQKIAMHATHTARDFFPANFYSPAPFTCIFSRTPLEFFL